MKNICTPFLGLTLLPLIALSAHAKTFEEVCLDVKSCVQATSTLTGDQYLYNDEIKGGKARSTSNVEMTAESASYLLSAYLSSNGYSRVPAGPKAYTIMRESDAKGMALPKYYATFTEDPKIQNTWDVSTLIYKAEHPESLKEMENVIRTFANMGARIYCVETSGILIISDRGINLLGLMPIIRANDVKLSPAMLKEMKERRLRYEKARSENSKQDKQKSLDAPRASATPAESKK